jgi:purine nucleosidase
MSGISHREMAELWPQLSRLFAALGQTGESVRSVISRKLQASLLVVGACIVCVCYAATAQAPIANVQAPINVILDTDVWGDVDDALALAVAHALHDRREINLVAVTISTDDKWCASYVDLVNTFYGDPQIPVGVARGGVDAEALGRKWPDSKVVPAENYTRLLAERKTAQGSRVYPHRLTDGTKASEAVSLLRKVLAAQPDESVVMIQVGYSTNLARLLDSGADANSALNGLDLIRKKVRLLSIMAGSFGEAKLNGSTIPKGSPEFNVEMDVPSAEKLFSDWPTPIVTSGVEVGWALLYPAQSIEHDYAYVKNHPIAESYHSYHRWSSIGWPHDHPTFDLTSVLYAARPDRNYFSLSKPGRVTVLPDGGSRFDEAENGPHRYLIVSEEQKARALEAMVMLASQPPVRRKP